MGAYHSTKNFEIFETGTNGTEISWEKFQKLPKIVEFPKSEPFNQKFRDGSQIEQKFPGKNFENLGVSHEVVLLFGIYANSQFSTQR